MKTQADWVWQMKAGCETCHQIGDKATRQIEPHWVAFPPYSMPGTIASASARTARA